MFVKWSGEAITTTYGNAVYTYRLAEVIDQPINYSPKAGGRHRHIKLGYPFSGPHYIWPITAVLRPSGK